MDAITPVKRGGRHSEFWTEPRTEKLKELWTLHLSASQIAEEIGDGITRSAVLGKVHRLELEPHGPSPRAPYRTFARIIAPRRKPAAKAPEPESVFTGPLNITFVDLQPNHCRYPVTDSPPHLFCGQPKARGASYCHHHYGITHSVGSNITDETRAARSANMRRVMPATTHAKLADGPIGLLPAEEAA